MRLIALTFLSLSLVKSQAQEHFMLVGTYDSPSSEGVYVYHFNSNTGQAVKSGSVKTPNPSFITVSPDERFVFAVHETAPQDGKGGDIAAFSFNNNNGTFTLMNRQLSGGDHPCHVETDRTGKWIFVSNYSNGTLSCLPINTDGSLGPARVIQHSGSGKHPQRQKGPHVHGAMISADNKRLYVTDLGIDKLMLYDFDASTGTLKAANPPYLESVPGSGPGLLSFHPTNKYAYMIEELSGTVVVYRNRSNNLKQLQRISTMKAGDSLAANSADVHASADGKFLYASNRGDVNSIAIYRIGKKGKLTLVGHQSTLGRTPRNFSIDPSGNYLLCANQNSDEIVVFKRDITSGLLSDTGNRISVGKPVCIKWISKN